MGVPRRRRAINTARRVPNYTWAGFVSAAAVSVPAATKVLLGTFTLSTSFDETMTRVRGHMDWVGIGASGAFGMIVISSDAAAIGITAIPGPVTDVDNDDWFLWQPVSDSTQAILDTKAQRIVREGSVIAMVAENAHASTGATIQLALRLLGRFRS